MRFLGFLLLSVAAAAQQYIISTYAGGGPPLPNPAPGLEVWIGAPQRIASDAGNIYFTSADLNSIFKLDPRGMLTRVAGNGRAGYSGDGGPAASARLQVSVSIFPARPGGLGVDGRGNLFIADTGNHCIRRVSPNGIISTVAGTGAAGYSGDGGPATSAQLSNPADVAVDGTGNLFIADYNNDRIRKVSASGIITTTAGNGTQGFSGDDGPATGAQLGRPAGVAVDSAGNVFIADSSNLRVRRVSSSAIITTVAGGATAPQSSEGEPATSAFLWYPTGVTLDGSGNLFIVVTGYHSILRVSPGGIVTTVAGNGTAGYSGDEGAATSAQLGVWPASVAVDGAGSLFIADSANRRIRKVSPGGIITTAAGSGTFRSFSGDGGPAASSQLNSPYGVAVDGAGNLFIADSGNRRIRKVSASGVMTTVAGDGTQGFSGDGGPAASGQLYGPARVAADGVGNLFIADTHRVRKVSPSGIITTVAGGGTADPSYSGPATAAQLGAWAVALGIAGNLYIADWAHRIRKVSPDGIIITVAGNGTPGFSGDGGPATGAQLLYPRDVAVDGAGNLLIADSGNARIRKVSPDGIITTVAGGPAAGAQLYGMTAVAVDGAGNLFISISDEEFFGNERILRVSASGIISTVAGAGSGGVSGDGGLATSAQLAGPAGLAVDGAGNVYAADAGNSAVRILRPTDRTVLISAVVDAASQRADPVSPGKIVVIYGAGFGPGATVSFSGIPAPVLYSSATQVNAVAPNTLTGTTAQVTVTYQGEASNAFTVPVAGSAPSLFTLNQTGAGQAAAINADGTVNTAANPVRIGGFISLFASGEGRTSLPVRVTVGGIPATVQYAGPAPGQVAGLMQVNVQIPSGVQPGGYVPVALQVGDRTGSPAVWIAVAN